MSEEGILAALDLYRVKRLRMDEAILCSRFRILDGVGVGGMMSSITQAIT